jgi:hypothetical protein
MSDREREEQRRFREANRERLRAKGRARYAALAPEKKEAARERNRLAQRERYRLGGSGRKYPAPRSLRELVRHLRRGWCAGEWHEMLRAEVARVAWHDHDEWLDGLDVEGGSEA